MGYRTIRDLVFSMYPKRARKLINHKKKRIRKKYAYLKLLDDALYSVSDDGFVIAKVQEE